MESPPYYRCSTPLCRQQAIVQVLYDRNRINGLKAPSHNMFFCDRHAQERQYDFTPQYRPDLYSVRRVVFLTSLEIVE